MVVKISLNPDEGFVKDMKQRIKDNDGYCPCRVERKNDNICMCKKFRDQVKRGQAGACHCGLYICEEN